jgi:hypothetical protein
MTGQKEYPPHQQRVLDERQELVTKVIALRAFIDSSPIFEKLDDSEKERLQRQHSIMTAYVIVLTERIDNFE